MCIVIPISGKWLDLVGAWICQSSLPKSYQLWMVQRNTFVTGPIVWNAVVLLDETLADISIYMPESNCSCVISYEQDPRSAYYMCYSTSYRV